MPELTPHAPNNPEFARVIELRQIRDLDEFDFDISPKPAEMPALARLLDARAVRKLQFAGRLTPLPRGGWQLDARLGATVIQTCVVSLDPVTTRIDQDVRRAWVPQGASPGAEVVVAPDEDDEVEPLTDRIDLGLVAIEALALALPAYPRKPGATLGTATAGGADGAPPDDDTHRPFAALAALRGKIGEGS